MMYVCAVFYTQNPINTIKTVPIYTGNINTWSLVSLLYHKHLYWSMNILLRFQYCMGSH